uniref:Uncharacterized protein n=1 Tax=uncultured marine virus TaxID=186617 RepID=A0A0F7L379_9VIRU|nr:hypothetical protein [uncultured marine virus]
MRWWRYCALIRLSSQRGSTGHGGPSHSAWPLPMLEPLPPTRKAPSPSLLRPRSREPPW